MAKTDSNGQQMYKGYALIKGRETYVILRPDNTTVKVAPTSREQARNAVNEDIKIRDYTEIEKRIVRETPKDPVLVATDKLQTKLYEKFVNTPIGEPRHESKQERLRIIKESLAKKTHHRSEMKYEFIRFHGWFAVVVRTTNIDKYANQIEVRVIVADHAPKQNGKFIWVTEQDFISRQAAEAMRTEAKSERNARKFGKQRKPHERIVYRKKAMA
jgi:hypothetical protein